MEDVLFWVSIVTSAILIVSYIIGAVANVLKLRKAIRDMKSFISDSLVNHSNQIGEENEMKKIFCDSCGKDVTASTRYSVNGLDYCEVCYEKYRNLEKQIEQYTKDKEALEQKIAELMEQLKKK